MTPVRANKGRWAVALFCVLLAGVGAFAYFEYVLVSRLPQAIVGKWVVVEGEMEGATAEFFRNGKMVWKVNVKGKNETSNGRAELDGTILRTTITNPITGETITDTQTIHILTSNHFIIEDQNGTILKMERLRM